jgi:uncharacterized repeat protein (TIGR01451 family)
MGIRHLGVAMGGPAAGAALAVWLLLLPAMRPAGAEGDILYSSVDNFDRANSDTLGTSSPGHSTWLEHEPAGSEDQLAISNTVLLATTSGVSGYEPTNASLDLTAEQAGFDLGAVAAGWAFHFDLNRNPSGWAASYYSLGWVLAANENDFASSTVDGYAVLWTGANDELVLVRFENGIAGTNPGTQVITTGLDWDAASPAGVNVRVEVSASGDWTLYWEEGEPLAAPLDIDANSAGGRSTAYFDDAAMNYSGPIWAHNTDTSATSSGDFDNFAFGIAPEAGGVSLVKQVSPATNVPYHGAVTYTAKLRNTGSVSDTNALFTDTLPAEVDFAAWLDRPAGAGQADDVITWSGTLTAGFAITFSFVASHVGAYGEMVSNTAQYSGTCLVSDTASFSVEPALQLGLVINEIDYDQPSTDAAEFIEIKNTTSHTTNLDAYTLEFVNGLDTGVYRTIDLPNVDLEPGGYYVVCGNTANVANCDLDASPDSNLIQNGAPDALTLVLGGSIVDAVSYEGDTGAPYTEGSGVGLEDDDRADSSISRFPDGADTGQNNVDLSRRCITPGQANIAANANCAPDVGIAKAVLPAAALPGERITYTLAFSNASAGTRAATGVLITDNVPISITMLSVNGSVTGGQITRTPGITYAWAVSDLTAGQSGWITISGILSEPLAAGTFSNTAVIAAEQDDNLANNQATAALALGTAYSSQLSGDWSAGSTWGGSGAPGPSDWVTVSAGTNVTVSAAAACYQLWVESEGTLAIAESGTLEVSGALENRGRLEQTRQVTGSAEVAFLATGSYGGLSINAGGLDLGRTQVIIEGNQDCTDVPGEAVQRCFEINPITATGRSATVTVFFDSTEIPPTSTCGTLNLFHWDGGWGAALALDGSYGEEGHLCGGDPQSLRAVGVSDFSAFVLKSAVPTAARLRELRTAARPSKNWGAGLAALAAGLAVAWRGRFGLHKKRLPKS